MAAPTVRNMVVYPCRREQTGLRSRGTQGQGAYRHRYAHESSDWRAVLRPGCAPAAVRTHACDHGSGSRITESSAAAPAMCTRTGVRAERAPAVAHPQPWDSLVTTTRTKGIGVDGSRRDEDVKRSAGARERRRAGDYFCSDTPFCASSRCVRRMLHQSLCSAIGIPHSTQTRTRCGGFRENSFFQSVIGPSVIGPPGPIEALT